MPLYLVLVLVVDDIVLATRLTTPHTDDFLPTEQSLRGTCVYSVCLCGGAGGEGDLALHANLCSDLKRQ